MTIPVSQHGGGSPTGPNGGGGGPAGSGGGHGTAGDPRLLDAAQTLVNLQEAAAQHGGSNFEFGAKNVGGTFDDGRQTHCSDQEDFFPSKGSIFFTSHGYEEGNIIRVNFAENF